MANEIGDVDLYSNQQRIGDYMNAFVLTAMFRARERRKETQPQHIDNSRLYAGSPMYFYCRDCGHESDVLPENYIDPLRRLCSLCQALRSQLFEFGYRP